MCLSEWYRKLEVSKFRVRQTRSNEDYLIMNMRKSSWGVQSTFDYSGETFMALRLDAGQQRTEFSGIMKDWALLSSPNELLWMNTIMISELYAALRKSYS
jgi:hypothetical protein